MSEELESYPEPPYSHTDVVRIIKRHIRHVPEQTATVGSLWWKREVVTKLAYCQLRSEAAPRAIYDAILTYLTSVEGVKAGMPMWIHLDSTEVCSMVVEAFNEIADHEKRHVRVGRHGAHIGLMNGKVATAVRRARAKFRAARYDEQTAAALAELGLEPAPEPGPEPGPGPESESVKQ